MIAHVGNQAQAEVEHPTHISPYLELPEAQVVIVLMSAKVKHT